jgi:hypothetical protein
MLVLARRLIARDVSAFRYTRVPTRVRLACCFSCWNRYTRGCAWCVCFEVRACANTCAPSLEFSMLKLLRAWLRVVCLL